MDINLDYIVKKIENCEYLEEKIEIFGTFFEYLDASMECLIEFGEQYAKEYANFLIKSIDMVIERANLEKRTIDYNKFMNRFFMIVNLHPISNTDFIKAIIEDIRVSAIDIEKGFPFISLTRGVNTTFQNKLAIYFAALNHSKNMTYEFIQLFGYENGVQIFGKIIEELLLTIKIALLDFDEMPNIEKICKEESKNSIMKKFSLGEIRVQDIVNVDEFYPMLTENEKKTYLLNAFNILSGYTGNESYFERVVRDDLEFFKLTEDEFLRAFTIIENIFLMNNENTYNKLS